MAQLHKRFNKYDLDNNGGLSKEEFREFFRTVQSSPPVSVDAQQTSFASYPPFTALLQHSLKHHTTTPQVLHDLFHNYCGSTGYMSAANLQRFLAEQQGVRAA